MSDKIFNNSGSVTTILGTLNQFHSFADLKYYDDIRTTLNAKYELNGSQAPTTVPLLQYFGIGIKGYKNTDGNQGARPFQPKCTNMDLYEPIPFRVVPVDSDLDHEARKRYRMRVVRTLDDNISYACYYLKTIEWQPNTVEIVRKDTDDIETTYALNPANLHPTPTDPSVGGSVEADRVIVRCTGLCEVTGAEVLEAVNTLYNGDLMAARISEMGFYTGCDVVVDENEAIVAATSVPTANQNYEAIYVQLAKHRCTLGTDLSDSGSSMVPYVSFESASLLDVEV